MKRAYIEPELQLLRLEAEDVLLTNSLPFTEWFFNDLDGDGIHDETEPNVVH